MNTAANDAKTPTYGPDEYGNDPYGNAQKAANATTTQGGRRKTKAKKSRKTKAKKSRRGRTRKH